MAKLNIPVNDYSKEVSTIGLPVADAILDADITTLFNAVDGISIGNFGQSSLVTTANKDDGGGGYPANQFAQRELKWLCRYQASGEPIRRVEVPCADAALLAANSDFMDLTAGAGATFKTAFEASVVDPFSGNAVTLLSAQLVGRNT